jgi:hypothetical protein
MRARREPLEAGAQFPGLTPIIAHANGAKTVEIAARHARSRAASIAAATPVYMTPSPLSLESAIAALEGV